MAFQPKVGTETPYVEFEISEVTSRDVQSRFSLKRFPTLSSTVVKTLGCMMYILFLAWQVIGLILYSIRVYETTLLANHTSYQATNITTYQFSEHLVLTWVISQILNTGLMTLAISKVPSFLGYSAILRLLVRLPSFWRLLFLYGISVVRYFLIGFDDSGKETALMLAFMLALHIYGIDGGISSTFSSLIGTIRNFASVVFKHKIYNFLLEKLFLDNRNILCHHDFLAGNSLLEN